MPKWTDKPWERQKGESAQAYEAFVTYRDMGAERSVTRVSQSLNKSRGLIGRWSSQWNWTERVRAYDNELEKEARAKAVKDRKAMTERHIGIAMQVQKTKPHLRGGKQQGPGQRPGAACGHHHSGVSKAKGGGQCLTETRYCTMRNTR